jgi:hypothetical protein
LRKALPVESETASSRAPILANPRSEVTGSGRLSKSQGESGTQNAEYRLPTLNRWLLSVL